MELVFAAESEFLRDVWIDQGLNRKTQGLNRKTQGLNRKTSMPVVVLFGVE